MLASTVSQSNLTIKTKSFFLSLHFSPSSPSFMKCVILRKITTSMDLASVVIILCSAQCPN